jgi:murein DD-endopeptidase MepM/ murein hydrolase activator NlpD
VKKLLALTAILIIFTAQYPGYCDELDVNQKNLLDIRSELQRSKQKLKITRAEEQRALSNLFVVRRNLERAKRTLTDARTRVVSNEQKMVQLKHEHDEAESKIKQRRSELKRRITEVYKSGGGSVMEILFASRTMSDFINRSYYFGRIIQSDADLISTMRQQVDTLIRTKVELTSTNIEIKQLVRGIESEKQNISVNEVQKKRLYESLKIRRMEYEGQVKALEADSRRIESFINSRGASKTVSSGKFSYPINGRLTCKFGWRIHPLWGGRNFHTGIDLAAPYGKPITASDRGEVIFSGWWGGYGKAVVIDHGRGYTTVYGHMSRVYAQTGQSVEKGQTIGLIGSTGYSTGPHVHFEIRVNGKPVDPMQFL